MLDNNLFYACSLVEYIGRERKQRRSQVVSMLGDEALYRIYNYADVLHSDNIASVAEQYANRAGIPYGEYDNVASCRYTVPSFWDIGKVFCRLVQDTEQGDAVTGMKRIFESWLSDEISNYNSDLYYQPRDYLRECYFEGKILL